MEYVHNPSNRDIVTNPQAIVDVLDPKVLLRREMTQGLSQNALCLIFDEVIRIVLACQPNNSLQLLEYQSQPLQNLKLHFSFFNNSNFESGDVVRQFIVQNNMNLAQFEQAEQSQNLNKNNNRLITKYGQKTGEEASEQGVQQTQSNAEDTIQNKSEVKLDVVMILIYLGFKLSAQGKDQAALKICRLCFILTKGSKFQRKHMQFVMQYLKQKNRKIEKLCREINIQNESNAKNNKAQLQEDLVKEKKVKLKWIMDFALNIIQALTCNRQQKQKAEESTTNRFDMLRVEEPPKMYEFDPDHKAQSTEAAAS